MNWLRTSAGIFMILLALLSVLGSIAVGLVWIGNNLGGVYAILGTVCLLAIVSAIAGFFAVKNFE